MEWTAKTMDRLHELYERHFDQLRADLITANKSLGSSRPEKTGLKRLTRDEFEALLRQPTDDPEVTSLWLRRIIRGHEQEFPELTAATSSPGAWSFLSTNGLSRQRQRRTGT